ncbi:hypothetical protein AB0J86_33900 [Micromonospora sp. NPDC049559]|uniref:hypothetical protein n=1 Tax=Micromonospora sp. NPDC049559 TaxID=3155923 RepID=UPI00341713BF
MSAPAAVSAPAGVRAVPEPPARFLDLVAAEWIKMRSLRSTPWVLVLVPFFVTGCAALDALWDYNNFPRYSPEAQREHMFALRDAFPVSGYWTLILVAAGMGAVAVVGEYGTGLIRTTMVAVPARASVVLAKAVLVALVWTAVGAVAAAGSFTASQLILGLRDAALPVTDPVAVRSLAASALLAPVCALIGLALGVLIRHGATTAVVAAFTLLMLPFFVSDRRRWSAEIYNAMVGPAWQRLTTDWTPPPGSGSYPGTVPGSWLAYLAWPVLLVTAALIMIRRRDV